MKNDGTNLKLGDVVTIDSPKRLPEINSKKGFISAHSYDGSVITAYTVTIDEECWFLLPHEVLATGERVNPESEMISDKQGN